MFALFKEFGDSLVDAHRRTNYAEAAFPELSQEALAKLRAHERFDLETDIHQHAFTGAFQVISGSSLHTIHEWRTEVPISSGFELGRSTRVRAERLRAGDYSYHPPHVRFDPFDHEPDAIVRRQLARTLGQLESPHLVPFLTRFGGQASHGIARGDPSAALPHDEAKRNHGQGPSVVTPRR